LLSDRNEEYMYVAVECRVKAVGKIIAAAAVWLRRIMGRMIALMYVVQLIAVWLACGCSPAE
jgi:hypothetical protein